MPTFNLKAFSTCILLVTIFFLKPIDISAATGDLDPIFGKADLIKKEIKRLDLKIDNHLIKVKLLSLNKSAMLSDPRFLIPGFLPELMKIQNELKHSNLKSDDPICIQYHLLRKKLARVRTEIFAKDNIQKAKTVIKHHPAPATTQSDNDDCANAIVITEGTFSGNTSQDTNDGSTSCGDPSPDVWYRYDSFSESAMTADTFGSNYDTVLSVHDGCPGRYDNTISCNDDYDGAQSSVIFYPSAGRSYWIRVSGAAQDSGDFQLHFGRAGYISGHVFDELTRKGIKNIEIDIDDYRGLRIETVKTDASGEYVSSELRSGSYRVIAHSESKYVSEIFDNVPCEGYCEPSLGTPVVVHPGSTTSNIDFALSKPGEIAGSIVSGLDGTPLSDMFVYFYDSTGRLQNYAVTNNAGRYSSNVPQGTIFVQTDSDDYINEIYNNIFCFEDCDPTFGTPVQIFSQETTSNINFALDSGGRISGTVRGEDGSLLQNFNVQVYDSSGQFVVNGYSDAPGHYTARLLRSGTYYVVANSYDGWLDELYPDILCNSVCDVTKGTAITVNFGQETSGIDFELKLGGTITGRMKAEGKPLRYAEVDIYDSTGDFASFAYTDDSGNYQTANALEAGNYFVIGGAYLGEEQYLSELYNNIGCPGGYACDPTTGTPISVTAGVTSGINFDLELGGIIQGTITSEKSGMGISAFLTIYDSNGEFVDFDFGPQGSYSTKLGLSTGNYLAIAENSSAGYITELYDDILCPDLNCELTIGTPIQVTTGQRTTDINFALSDGGHISGHISDSQTGMPIKFIKVIIYDELGNYVTDDNTDSNGDYFIQEGLFTGNYFAIARDPYHYIGEIWDDIPCPNSICDPTSGTPIPVNVGETSFDINFALDRGGNISGTIVDSKTGLPLRGTYVSIYDSSGYRVSSGETTATGEYISDTTLVSGNYFVVTYDWYHKEELYDNIPCEEDCDPTTGTPVAVIQGSTTSGINFALDPDPSCGSIVLDPNILPEAIVDQPYQVDFTVRGGIPPYEYQVNGLPPGLTLDSNGKLFGIPEYPGIYAFYISIFDANYCGNSQHFVLKVSGCFFCDDFSDGIQSWREVRPSWSESGSSLIGTSTSGKAVILADNLFSGCSGCAVNATMKTSGGGKVWLLGWVQDDKNQIELLMNESANRWVLKQRVNGIIKAKAKANAVIDPGINYQVRIVFDGTQFDLLVDGISVLSMQKEQGSKVNGTVGFQVKGTIGTFDSVGIN
jgi:hypothetical protein